MVIGLWFLMGLISLIILTYQDFKHNMQIDDRRNWFMLGATLMLLVYVQRSIWYILVVAIGILLITWLFGKLRSIGQGDISALTWILSGFAYINPIHSTYYLIILSMMVGVELIAKKILKIARPTPMFLAITLSFVCNGLLNGYLLS